MCQITITDYLANFVYIFKEIIKAIDYKSVNRRAYYGVLIKLDILD